MKVNFDDHVRVKLTSWGKEVHSKYYERYLGVYSQRFAPTLDEEGYTIYTLRDFMNIFGEHVDRGINDIIDPRIIEFVDR